MTQMGGWAQVQWTEAGQITGRLGWEVSDADAAASPETYFARLRGAGRLHDAAFFLGQALPRFEAVTWAARAVRDLGTQVRLPDPDADALKAALLWVQDPSETRRRAAWDAAALAGGQAPERLTALAVFFSGGSIAPVDCNPVPAPKEAAGRFGAGAVVLAALRQGAGPGGLQAALDAGVAMASGGTS